MYLAPNTTTMLRSILIAMAAAIVLAVPRRTEAAERPNIVVIVADDLGWRDVGYHGSEIATPNFDRLAAEGVRLEAHYVFPVCSPTRAGLLSGRNPSRYGILGPIGGRSELALPTETHTLADLLKSRGYETAISGKWHLGLRPEVGPRQYGFDSTYGYLHGQLDQYSHRYKNGDRTWHRQDVFIDEVGHATDLIAAEAVRFVEARHEGPFFLYVAFSVPHTPLQEDDTWTAPYREAEIAASRKVFAASVTHMDAGVGRIAEALERTGKRSDTLVIFTSDNGGQQNYRSDTDYGGIFGPYDVLGDNRPLRGWKGSMYEGGVRVPAFALWPGRLEPRMVDAVVSVLDWYPTLAALTGEPADESLRLEGQNIWPQLEGVAGGPRRLYWKTGSAYALRDGPWKLMTSRRGEPSPQLFRLDQDPNEEDDLAAAHPERVARLFELLDEQKRLDP